MSVGAICGRHDCRAYGTHRPIVTVRAWIGEKGMDVTLDVPVCADHQDAKLDDLVSETTWRAMSTSYRATRPTFPPPLRGLASLKWEPLGDSLIFDGAPA